MISVRRFTQNSIIGEYNGISRQHDTIAGQFTFCLLTGQSRQQIKWLLLNISGFIYIRCFNPEFDSNLL
jgi:hypothetical protein